jgi:glycosyltransferase involved in cell wall biosynthesis
MLVCNSKISVIIPSYNRGYLIVDTIESLQAQTYPHWECIIVDDGSTDNSKQCIEQLMATDSRFKYIYQENSGPGSARATGLAASSGDFVQFLDSDDLISSNRFERCILAVEKFDFIVTNFDRFISVNEQFYPPYCKLSQERLTLNSIVLEWDKNFTIPIHCGFFNSKIFQKVKILTSLKMYEDWLMWTDIFLAAFTGKFIDETLAHYRFSHNSLSSATESLPRNRALAINYIYQQLQGNIQKEFFQTIITRLCDDLTEAYANTRIVPAENRGSLRQLASKIKKKVLKK